MSNWLRHRTWRISWALTAGIGLAVVVTGLSSGWLVYSLAQRTLIQEGIQEIAMTAKISAKKLMQEYQLHPTRATVEDLSDLASGHLYLLLANQNGGFVGASGPIPPFIPHTVMPSKLVQSSGWIRFHATPYVYAGVPLIIHGHSRELIVVDGLDRTAALLSALRTALLFGELLLALSSTLAVVLIVRQLTDPLRSLEAVAGTVTLNRENSQHVEIASNLTEVVSLTDSFNNMLNRLMNAQERERQFTSHAAHSLRTPIHLIRGYARSLSQWGHDDPEIRHRTLKALARESQAMETLVDRLLQLSRVEQNHHVSLRRIAVEPYLKKILPNLRDCCPHHPLSLEFAHPDIPDIVSEPDLLEVVLRTLVENADAYADKGTAVILFVVVLPEVRSVRIGVVNQGPDLSSDSQAHLFDRFYRAHQPASSQHFGLGLAIADSIVTRIQGRWTIQSHHGRNTFAVDLPT